MLTQTERDSMQATINALTPLIANYDSFERPPVALNEGDAGTYMAALDGGRAAACQAMIPILRESNWPLIYSREVHDPLFEAARSALAPFCRCENSAKQWAQGLHAVVSSQSKKSAFSDFEQSAHAISVARMVVTDFTALLAA